MTKEGRDGSRARCHKAQKGISHPGALTNTPEDVPAQDTVGGLSTETSPPAYASENWWARPQQSPGDRVLPHN